MPNQHGKREMGALGAVLHSLKKIVRFSSDLITIRYGAYLFIHLLVYKVNRHVLRV